jgi:hypothetical protein
LRLEIEQNLTARMNFQTEKLSLELAGRRITTLGAPTHWLQELPGRLLDCRIAEEAEPHRIIRVEIEDDERLLPPAAGHDLNEVSTLSFEPSAIRFHSDWCEGCLDLRTDGELALNVHPAAGPWFGGLLENALRLLMAYDALESGGVLLHSAAIVRKNRAMVLFGHSGAGKSTTSGIALEAGWLVVSDDVNLIQRGPGGWEVRQVPFSGSLNANAPGMQGVPLDGLFRLHKSECDRLVPCSTAHATSLLFGSAPFANQDPYRGEPLLDILAGLVNEVAVQDLYFSLSPRFLDLILKEPDQ